MDLPFETGILVVGTEHVYCKNMVDMLVMLGFENTMEALDGARAWEIINRERIGIIIAQWEMSEMSGMALLRLIRGDARFSDTPVLLWTQGITRAHVVRAGEAGVSGIIVDPVGVDALEAKIHTILEFEMNPDTKKARTYMDRGDVLADQQNYDDALKEYGKVLNILESAEVYYNIGYIKTAKGEYDEALAAFRKATQLNQMFAKAYKAMADVYLKMGNKANAKKYLQMAGDIFLERDMHESAENVFNEILEINPDTINVYNSLGILYRRQERYEDAVGLYRKAIKISPNDENIQFNLGRTYLDLNNPDMARKYFIGALKINPQFDLARGMLKAIESART
ncbi:MAG: tetratricopeptide repeat protein, partial [Thermodesulfobacteriota bacterium]|nr:tetratricopeptide repeat protein [Thermodesulfobacteriota bacterium]